MASILYRLSHHPGVTNIGPWEWRREVRRSCEGGVRSANRGGSELPACRRDPATHRDSRGNKV